MRVKRSPHLKARSKQLRVHKPITVNRLRNIVRKARHKQKRKTTSISFGRITKGSKQKWTKGQWKPRATWKKSLKPITQHHPHIWGYNKFFQPLPRTTVRKRPFSGDVFKVQPRGPASFETRLQYGRQENIWGKQRDFMSQIGKSFEYKKKGKGFYRPLHKEYPYRITKHTRRGVGRWFGPYPNPLGIKMIMEISPSPQLKKHFSHPRFTEGAIMTYYTHLKEAMLELHEKVIGYAWELIEKYVPRDTGALRDSLLSSLTEVSSIVPSDVQNLELKLRFFSELGYAGIVNRMPNKMIQHDQSEGIRGRTGLVKHDPDAVKGFFSVVILNLQNAIKNVFIKEFIQDVRKIIYNGYYPISYNYAKSLFRYKGVHPV